MKRTVTSFFATAWILALAGCFSPTKTEAAAIPARTFSFVNIQGKQPPAFAEREEKVHKVVKSAITQSLAAKKLSFAEQGGDVTVAYLIVLGNNAAVTSVSDYFGYGRDSSELVNKAHKKYSGNKNPNYFEAGTLLIDIIDSKTWKVLKRGYATRPLLKDPSAEERAARVHEAVEEILKDVRFKQ